MTCYADDKKEALHHPDDTIRKGLQSSLNCCRSPGASAPCFNFLRISLRGNKKIKLFASGIVACILQLQSEAETIYLSRKSAMPPPLPPRPSITIIVYALVSCLLLDVARHERAFFPQNPNKCLQTLGMIVMRYSILEPELLL